MNKVFSEDKRVTDFLKQLERENLRFGRSFALDTLKRYREGWLPAETAAINLLDMRRHFTRPFVTKRKGDTEHPFAVLSDRLVRIATRLMGEEWVENYIKNQRKNRR